MDKIKIEFWDIKIKYIDWFSKLTKLSLTNEP